MKNVCFKNHACSNEYRLYIFSVFVVIFLAQELNAQVLWYGDPNLSVNDNFRRLDPNGNSNPTGDRCVDDPNNPPFVTKPTDPVYGKFWRITKPISRKRAEFARTTGDINSFVPQKAGTYYYGWRWRINATPNLADGGIAVFQWKTDEGGDINTNKQNYPFNMEYDGSVLHLNAFGPAEPNWNRPGSITQRRTTLWQQAIQEDTWVTFVIKVKVEDTYDGNNNRYDGYIEFWFNGEQQTLSNIDFDEYQVVLANSNTRAYHKTFDGIEVYPKWGAYNENACDFEVITDFDDMRVASTYAEALPSNPNGGNPNGLEGIYKIKHSVTSKYWTVDNTNSNIITADEMTPDSATQIFEVKSVGTTGYYNISCADPNWDAVRFHTTNVYPTTTSTPTTDTNNTRIFEILSNGSGAYDIHTPQTTTGRYAYDNSGDVNYTGSASANTKWILEDINSLGSEDFDKSSIFVSNPVDNQILINGLDDKVNKIEVFNIMGKSILVQDVKKASSMRIDANTLTNGLYLVKFYGKTSIFTIKFIKR
ncbi:heparin lyase I family protein [uncultured Algibacter sp.]|uniref:heparin lyase I family protein n=1 Tax=uncultured Algibacter sp. TaxID=298659 RepID=UPI00260CCF15|nr:heparin lyase I family protein [uncultured Algibacter sp.]